ncbi:SpoIIE family protein phosphatase [Tenuifilum osseticum]|uniref:SpoIIE family protein phosphatase n=1 Tax=Tenuifilum osseticum TaxID=3374723 RepID=UPI0034E568AB
MFKPNTIKAFLLLAVFGILTLRVNAKPVPLDNIDSLKYFENLTRQYERDGDKVKLVETLIAKSQYLFNKKNFDNALIEANQALIVSLDMGREQYLEKAYYLLSQIHIEKGLLYESIDYLYPGYRYSIATRDSLKIGWYLLSISKVEGELGRLNNAIENNLTAINFFKSRNDSLSLAKIYTSQGIIHTEFGNFVTAQSYLENAIAILKVVVDSTYLGITYRALANNSLRQSNNLMADKHLKKSETYLKNNPKELARTQTVGAELLINQQKPNSAIPLLQSILNTQNEINDRYGQLYPLLLLGKAHARVGNYSESKKYLLQCLKQSESLSIINISRLAYKELSQLEELQGNKTIGYQYLRKYISLTDSLFNYQIISEANRLENISALRQKEKEIQHQRENLLLSQANLNKSRLRQLFLVGFIAILIVLVVVSYLAYRNKQKANLLLAQQKEKIEKQKNMLEQRSRDITDSLNYARRIQKAILQTSEQPTDFFDDSFLIFLPKELVSGDFYWFKRFNNQMLFAVADCTGHGAPGAFMSIIGMFGLNQIVSELNETNPGEVLQNLNGLFHKSFEQREGSEIFDGMDIAFCNYNPETRELRYSGANIYLNIVRKSNTQPVSNIILNQNETHTLYQVKCERQSIGYVTEKVSFSTHSVQLEKDDIIYLYTDGFTDQFGGPNGKKFRLVDFRNMLCSIASYPMAKQKDFLLEIFSEWKGNNVQVDDVTVMGIRIT